MDFAIKLVGSNRRLVQGHKRWYSAPNYKACKDELTYVFRAGIKARGLEAVSLEARISKQQWRGDLDNVLKVILDALQAAGVVKNDKYINPLYITWTDEKESKVRIEYEE